MVRLPHSSHTKMLSQRNPALAAKIAQLSLPLAPLVSLPNGQVHPQFPKTLLGFWLLTTDQLEELAHFYHQRTPGPWSNQYPCPIKWNKDATIGKLNLLPLSVQDTSVLTPILPKEEKRMKLGRFIGLRGCESPSELLTQEDIMEEVRKEREQQEEKDSFQGKRKWY